MRTIEIRRKVAITKSIKKIEKEKEKEKEKKGRLK